MTESVNVPELIHYMDLIEDAAKKFHQPEIPQEAKRALLDISKVTTKQPETVTLSPTGWNLLEVHGYPHKQPLSVDAPLTKGEEVLYETISEKLKTKFGPRQESYRLDMPIDDENHYLVDNWRNLKENMRDQVPGEGDMRHRAFQEYTKPKPSVNVRQLLQHDPLFVKAVGMVMDVLPRFTATKDIVEASIPFMTKYKNVGYLGPIGSGLNARSIVPGTQLTAAEYARHLAEEIMDAPMATWLPKVMQFNVWVALGRNKRAKGRAIEASSRVTSLVYNQIEHPQIEACKTRSPPYAGYKPPQGLKEALIVMCEFCKSKGLWATNWDQSSYDVHVPPDLISLVGAIWMTKANGEKAKHLAYMRSVNALRGWLLNGMTGKIEEIFGRIFSGYIDTNLSGSTINLIASLFILMVLDPDYSPIWYECLYTILVMGDDSLQIHRQLPDYHAKQVEAMSKYFGFEVNPNKGEEGIFFLQRRLFKPKGWNEYVMVTPVTRCIRSFFFKESPSPLGKFGWVIANLQLVDMIREYPPALDMFVEICMPYDKMQLGVTATAAQLAEGVKLEDQIASFSKKQRTKRNARGRNNHQSSSGARKRVRYSADIIFDGDPTKNELFIEVDGKPVLNQGFVDEMLAALRASAARVQPKMLVEPYSVNGLLTELREVASNAHS